MRTDPSQSPTVHAAQGPGSLPAPKKPLCGYCGADGPDGFDVLSRHRTSVGITVWLRCSCDALQVRVITPAGAQLVARGRRRA